MKNSAIKYCIGLFLVIVATAIVANRWDVWFGNPIEEEYTSLNTPYRILLTPGDNPNSHMVTWQCDTILQDAYIEYYKIDSLSHDDRLHRATAAGEKYISDGGSSIFYRAILDSLTQGKYAYRVCHPTTVSEWNNFEISDTNDHISRFVFMGDIQDTLNGITSDIVTDITQRHNAIDFFVLGGDFIHRPQDIYWGEGFRSIAPIATSHPIVAVSGNHEHRKGIASTCEKRFPLHFAYYLDRYNKENFCYHTFRYDNVELYLLDSHCDIIRLVKQRRALQQDLEKSTAQWKIVILHHPPYSIRNKWNNIHLQWLFTPLFTQHKVHLVLSGHEHGYARIHPQDDNATPLYTISHCSPKHYQHNNSKRAVCYDSNNRYYQVIDIEHDTLQLACYNSIGLLMDRTQIVQGNDKCKIQ